MTKGFTLTNQNGSKLSISKSVINKNLTMLW